MATASGCGHLSSTCPGKVKRSLARFPLVYALRFGHLVLSTWLTEVRISNAFSFGRVIEAHLLTIALASEVAGVEPEQELASYPQRTMSLGVKW